MQIAVIAGPSIVLLAELHRTLSVGGTKDSTLPV